MNYMKEQRVSQNHQSLQELANSIGDFIRYWGFRRIHGSIWTILYLSKKPLTGAELVEKLQVSKALISSALSEMEGWELIVSVDSDNAKAKFFRAESDVIKVIHKVLVVREKVMLEKVKFHFDVVKSISKLGLDENINPERLKNLGAMIDFAVRALRVLIKINNFKLNLKLLSPEA